jgi:TolB protein
MALLAIALLNSRGDAQAAQGPRIQGGLPYVSPDGQYIAFTTNRNGRDELYLTREDGSGITRLAVTSATARWSADSKRVAFSRGAHDTATLVEVGLDGSGERPIATAVAQHELQVLRDGKHLLFSAGDYQHSRLTITDLDGTHARVLTDGSAGIFNLAVSSDGEWVAYTRLDSSRAVSVWVMKLDGTGARAISNIPPSEGRPQWPSWSPDGKRIAVQSGVYDQKNPSASTAHIWVINVATGAATKLAAHDRPYLDETPSWFPDGRRIAFQSDRSGRMEIWVMNSDGTNARQVTK